MSKTSFRVVGSVALLTLMLAGISVPAAAQTSGRLRELVCRGKVGIDLHVDRDPSPRDAREVAMVLKYQRSTTTPGTDYKNLDAGACSWNPGAWADLPPEPGVAYFDLPNEAQRWSDPGTRDMDTTALAAEHFPDVISVPRYLKDSTHYWVFYVDDVSHIAVSFRAWGTSGGPPRLFTVTGSLTSAPSTSSPSTTAPSGAIAGPVSKASPVRSAPQGTVGGVRSPGGTTAGVATLVRAPLRLEGVDRALDKFTIRFSARTNASPKVVYTEARPVQEPSTGRWFFPDGWSGWQYRADVRSVSTQGFRTQYAASAQQTGQRGKVYHYVITVPASAEYPEEQTVGQFTMVSQSVVVSITSVTILKMSNLLTRQDLSDSFSIWSNSIPITDEQRLARTFRECGPSCANTSGDTLGLLVFVKNLRATPNADPVWTSKPGLNYGIAKRVFDLRTIPDDRPLRSFTLRSMSGEIEFEVQGTLQVIRR